MKKNLAVSLVVFCVLAAAAFGFQVTERYKLGAMVESASYHMPWPAGRQGGHHRRMGRFFP